MTSAIQSGIPRKVATLDLLHGGRFEQGICTRPPAVAAETACSGSPSTRVVSVSRDWAESLAIIKPLPGRAARDGEQCRLRRRRRRDLATTKSHGGPPRACHTDTNSETAKPDAARSGSLMHRVESMAKPAG